MPHPHPTRRTEEEAGASPSRQLDLRIPARLARLRMSSCGRPREEQNLLCERKITEGTEPLEIDPGWHPTRNSKDAPRGDHHSSRGTARSRACRRLSWSGDRISIVLTRTRAPAASQRRRVGRSPGKIDVGYYRAPETKHDGDQVLRRAVRDVSLQGRDGEDGEVHVR